MYICAAVYFSKAALSFIKVNMVINMKRRLKKQRRRPLYYFHANKLINQISSRAGTRGALYTPSPETHNGAFEN
jgi:hypothetical protein